MKQTILIFALAMAFHCGTFAASTIPTSVLVAALERFQTNFNDSERGPKKPMTDASWTELLEAVKDVALAKDGVNASGEALTTEQMRAAATRLQDVMTKIEQEASGIKHAAKAVTETEAATPVTTISGTTVNGGIDTLPPGLYIYKGKKIVVR